MKIYLNTLEPAQVIKRLSQGQFIFVDDEDNHFIHMVNGTLFEHSDKYGWRINPSCYMNGLCYFEDEDKEEEATENDIGKLCYMWDNNRDRNVVRVLGRIGTRLGNKYPYSSKEGTDCWRHCRILTPSEVEQITGYKVKEEQ